MKKKLAKVGAIGYLLGFIALIVLVLTTKNIHYYFPALFVCLLSLIFILPSAWDEYKWLEMHKNTITSYNSFYRILIGIIGFFIFSIVCLFK